jgi:hypothetical protein
LIFNALQLIIAVYDLNDAAKVNGGWAKTLHTKKSHPKKAIKPEKMLI